jgi:hypothetical protein
MADRFILSTMPKLNGSNWFEWKKEAETFLMLAGLADIIDYKNEPTDAAKNAEWLSCDKKTYAYLYFLIELNYHHPIVEVMLGCNAWIMLVAKYEKDSATTQMVLCQHFYSLVHDLSVGVAVFTLLKPYFLLLISLMPLVTNLKI